MVFCELQKLTLYLPLRYPFGYLHNAPHSIHKDILDFTKIVILYSANNFYQKNPSFYRFYRVRRYVNGGTVRINNNNDDNACVRGFPMVPFVGNICTISTNLITNGITGKEIDANGKNGNAIGTNGTNVTNQWYYWENPEHTH